MFEKGRIIVGFFHQSTVASDTLEKTQKFYQIQVPLKLIQDVVTRWNSSYDMFERLVHLKRELTVSLIELEREDINFTTNEWEIVIQIAKTLELFKVNKFILFIIILKFKFLKIFYNFF